MSSHGIRGAWELLATTNIVGVNNRYQSLKLPATGALLNQGVNSLSELNGMSDEKKCPFSVDVFK